ncbi:MAG: helix-turn-helix transcriptional regulator [Firmicutes bacterium]|nr:helix-turn-helix transcriptional regulator [Bacillota bacterium]
MLKTYLQKNKMSIYQLSQKSGIPYSTLNDLANHKLPVANLRCGQLYALSAALGITMDEFYKLCSYSCTVYSDKYSISGTVTVKHKSYYLTFEKSGILYEDLILPVKQEATLVIRELARWKLEERLSEIIMEEAYETVYAEKTR